MQSWMYLVFAILFEVMGTTSMKYSNGFSKIVPSILMGIFYLMSLASLTVSLKKINMGSAYAIWSGVGTALISVIGIFLFKEQMSLLKAASIVLIVVGVVMLNLAE